MPFYEVVYETGRNSVAEYQNDEEAMSACGEQDRRARAGERSLLSEPTSPPAERIVKMFVYDKHPDDYNRDMTLSAEVLTTDVDAIVAAAADENGVVQIYDVIDGLQQLVHPMKADADKQPQDSMYKMESQRELTLDAAPPAPETTKAA